jgi:DNA-binding response OmpR family regulator
MSANDDPRERADAFTKGVSDLMLKPFDMSEFLIRVNILLFQ